MAVLGFIGICGVLRTTGSSPAPRAVEWLAAALAVAALGVACLAVFHRRAGCLPRRRRHR